MYKINEYKYSNDPNDSGIVTAIDDALLLNDNAEYYSIDGQKLNGQPTTKGIYISNGRKIIVK